MNNGMNKAEAAASEIQALEAENSRLQQQVDLIKAYDTSGLDMTGTYAEPIEAEIRRNAQRIKAVSYTHLLAPVPILGHADAEHRCSGQQLHNRAGGLGRGALRPHGNIQLAAGTPR